MPWVSAYFAMQNSSATPITTTFELVVAVLTVVALVVGIGYMLYQMNRLDK